MTVPFPLSAPKHVAIIMDGNGRWAQARGKLRTYGHRIGIDALERTVKAAREMGIEYLTLFGFSTENWRRPKSEVDELMRLMRHYLKHQMNALIKDNVRVKVIGDRARLPADIVSQIEQAEAKSAEKTGITVTIALSYSGRFDLAQAMRKIAAQHANGECHLRDINEESISDALQTAGTPDPDLLIRTSGEQRISNFLLWQCAYAEFYFCQDHWPDFGEQQLQEAVIAFNSRKRRFGGLKHEQRQSA